MAITSIPGPASSQCRAENGYAGASERPARHRGYAAWVCPEGDGLGGLVRLRPGGVWPPRLVAAGDPPLVTAAGEGLRGGDGEPPGDGDRVSTGAGAGCRWRTAGTPGPRTGQR